MKLAQSVGNGLGCFAANGWGSALLTRSGLPEHEMAWDCVRGKCLRAQSGG
jgi:hypothetical protein